MARDHDGLPVVLMATMPVLTLRVGWGFVRFQAGRKRGVRQFRRTLIQGGMPKDQADRLALAYHEAGSVRTLLKAGLPGR